MNSLPATSVHRLSLDGHCARDRGGPGEGTLRFDERINFGGRLGRESGSAPRLEVGVGVHALEDRGEIAAGLVRHKHQVMAKASLFARASSTG